MFDISVIFEHSIRVHPKRMYPTTRLYARIQEKMTENKEFFTLIEIECYT